MKFRLLSITSCALAAVLVFGCQTSATSTDDTGALIEDGSLASSGDMGYQTGLDTTDGALTVGDGYSDQDYANNNTFLGPQELRANNTIYFKYDSEQIQDQFIAVMQAHAQYLRDNPDSRIIIEGHTDERGTPEYNIALGERRARSVARYMQNLGVDVGQLSIVSYGEEKPAEVGHTEASWSKNRRAVINY